MAPFKGIASRQNASVASPEISKSNSPVTHGKQHRRHLFDKTYIANAGNFYGQKRVVIATFGYSW